jgi:archaellin
VVTPLPPMSKTGGMFGKKTDDLFLQKKEQIAEKLKSETVVSTNDAKEITSETVVVNQNEPYTETDLNNAWIAFIVQLDKASLSFMKERKLVIHENDKISVIFASNHEKTLCEDQRLNALQYFRINLKNTQINLEFEVDNTLIPETKSLSNEDKFNKMVEQNPDLATLRQLLELEIEY